MAFLANNIGFGMVRSHQAAEYVRMNQQQPTHSQPASLSSSQATLPGTASQNGPLAPPHLFSPPPSLHHNPNQAYIWAPIPTPSRRRDGTIRRPRLPAHISEYFSGDGQNSDTDDGAVADASVLTEDASSPELPKAIMAPPETPSRRTASPTRVDMNGSPTRRRSPGKAW